MLVKLIIEPIKLSRNKSIIIYKYIFTYIFGVNYSIVATSN